jgi:hypothetical protein
MLPAKAPRAVELLEARDVAEVDLESPEDAFDVVAALVHGTVVPPGFDTGAHWRDDRDEGRVERELAGSLPS